MNSRKNIPHDKNIENSKHQTLTIEEQELTEVLKQLKTRIKVIGCGGAGSNTITRIFESNIPDVELIAANTDAQHLLITKTHKKLLLGRRVTGGLGAGALPDLGEESAKEAEPEIHEELKGVDIVFVTAGLGGGTGTGGAPIIAKVAKDEGALVIAIVTLPFTAEGQIRMNNALTGLEKLKIEADTTIVIKNDKLLELIPRMPIALAFRVADELLMRAINGISEMIIRPGLINLDFNDLSSIMKNAGVAMIGLGESDGDNRIEKALKEALESPLLDLDITGATGVLVNVVGGENMTMAEAEKAVAQLQQRVSENARIIWGAAVRPEFRDKVSVMVVVTGIKGDYFHT